MKCLVYSLGVVPYAEALTLQNRLVEQRSAGERPDTLLLLQHPHTYTYGSAAKPEHLLMPPQERERLGVTVVHSDRGGDITYHGVGQMVGYPILALGRDGARANVVGYVRKLETTIIRLLAEYGVVGKPIPSLTGVWVDTPAGEAKICAIGVRVNVKMITKHGFALNLNTDLRYFDGIVPCGIRDKGVTSLAALLGQPVDEDEARRRLIRCFGEVFGYTVELWNLTPQSALQITSARVPVEE